MQPDNTDIMTTWRLNDHRSFRGELNKTIKAPKSMFLHEVMLKVTTKQELNNMKLVVATEPDYNGSERPIIHIYERI